MRERPAYSNPGPVRATVRIASLHGVLRRRPGEILEIRFRHGGRGNFGLTVGHAEKRRRESDGQSTRESARKANEKRQQPKKRVKRIDVIKVGSFITVAFPKDNRHRTDQRRLSSIVAYRCLLFGFTSRKCRIEEHQCIVCQFRTGDNSRSMSDTRTLPLTPGKYIQCQTWWHFMGQDVVKLSKEDSAEHWLSVGQVTDEEDIRYEDIRQQLLRHELMTLAPPRAEPERARPNEVVLHKDAELQTAMEPPQSSAMEQAVMRIDSNFTQMYTQTKPHVQSSQA